MEAALVPYFEDQLRFRLETGEFVEGSIFLGESTELFAVETLRYDEDAYTEEYNLWLDRVWTPEQLERRAEILSFAGNAKRYEDLIECRRRGQLVPFVGSGMSAPSGLPTWSEFLRRVAAFAECDTKQLEELLTAAHYEDAADVLLTATNARLFAERISHELRLDGRTPVLGPVRLLPLLFREVALTSNLDRILERVYAEAGCPWDQTFSGIHLGNFRGSRDREGSALLKMHGDCETEEGRIILSSEYDTAYGEGSLVRDEVSLMFRTHHLLFLGCGLGVDRTVRLLGDLAAADKSMPKHYAFLALPDGGDQDVDTWRIQRENELTALGIYPIWYRLPHDDAITALLDGLWRFV